MNLEDINKLIKMYDEVVINCDRLLELITQSEIFINGLPKKTGNKGVGYGED